MSQMFCSTISLGGSHSTVLERICSQCSWLSRGIGEVLKGASASVILKKAATKEKAKKKAQEGSSTEVLANSNLEKIEQHKETENRMQFFEPERRVLFLACGDGKHAVYVNSKKEVTDATVGFRTKLQREWVEEFVAEDHVPHSRELSKRLQDTLVKYLHFDDKRLYLFESLWITGTYLYSAFGHYGYLFVYSEKMRCGKTRTLEVLSHLAYEATEPLNAPTPATIREIATDGKTIQMDTLERWRLRSPESHAAAMELLDAGFRKGGKVAKMVQIGGGRRWRGKEFPVYTPYNLSGIKKNSLSDTALDRSFAIEMKRKPLEVRKEKYNHFRCEEECREIRRDLYFWALRNAEKVSCVYESKELQEKIDPLGLNDRGVDIWLPLFAILQVLGFDEQSEEWQELSAIATKLHRDPEIKEIERQLAIIKALKQKVNGHKEIVAMSTELVEYFKTTNLKVTDFKTLMDEWGFKKESKRLPDFEKPRKVWVLPVDQLQELEQQLIRSLPYTPKTATTATTSEGQLEAFCTSGDSPGEESNDDR